MGDSIKDMVVSLLLDLPGRNDEHLHEEGVLELMLSMLHHLEKVLCQVPT
jgi:hypothetical protein